MKKMMLIALLITSPVYAHEYCDYCTLDQKIDVASKSPVMQSDLGKSVDYLDSYLLNESKPLFAIDALQGESGVYTKKTGGFGSIETIRLRGARAIDTKLLLNGIQLSDASDPQSSYVPFLGDMTMDGIDHVEVMKGASSSVHGSSAIGGVVDYEGKWYEKDGVSYTQELGSFSTTKEALELQAHGLYLTLSELNSDGIDKNDEYSNATLYSSYKFENDKVSIKPFMRVSKVIGRINNPPFISGGMVNQDGDDENDRRDYNLQTYGNTLELNPTDWLKVSDKTGYNRTYRRFEFLPNEDGSGFYADGAYYGNDWTNDLSATFNDALTIGWLYKDDSLRITSTGIESRVGANHYSNDYYAEYKGSIQDTNFIFGLRDATDEFSKGRLIYDVAVERETPIGRLTSHYGTAYRIPSPYEQHGSFLSSFGLFDIGNPGLSPERAETFDIGLSEQPNQYITYGATSFYSTITNKIDFVGAGYQNISGTSSIDGLEAYYEQFFGGFSGRLAYTLTNHAGVDVPQNALQGSLRFEKGKWKGSVRGTWNGKHKVDMFDLDTFLVDRVGEDAYGKVDATLSYKANKNTEVYVRVENLLDNDYTISGYRQAPFEAYLGVKVSL